MTEIKLEVSVWDTEHLSDKELIRAIKTYLYGWLPEVKIISRDNKVNEK